MDFLTHLKFSVENKKIPEKVGENFRQLYTTYAESIREHGMEMEKCDPQFFTFLERVEIQVAHPYTFQPFHQRILEPFNYYNFGIEFMRPLVNTEKSHLMHISNLDRILRQLENGENVILFANHQTEVDPILISIALEEKYPKMGNEMIFVAGDRVITDPMAIPFSMGRNLLCIYSKRHIANPPEKKEEKQMHNQKTMKRLRQILAEGGKCVYVAPSGGRDRLNEAGIVTVSQFDPQSIEMFRLIAKQAGKPAHFYPLALDTFDILPPPRTIEAEVGEIRTAQRIGIGFCFGDEIDLDHIPEIEKIEDRHARRSALADYIWNIVKNDYDALKKD